uniref:P-type sodium-transporting ATPase4 n=1 Tax=Chromera velia CCMP2878 TaxID=1169474 RepID=A0A0G4H8W2_9ALVE|eukprot:Cvel_5916.t1-p1 / transcript=Cvel_5916.t1 / gene=Cvel_5916 / organism=Chromera_velia_CCMP2878 / gene_product=Probable cation-transporting ATPase F, putative / transcript_product=Probable cation-transporting ATPase F, putative / location=Cvel_scaffold283:18103-30359(-) / protein_length=1433 / sequence_SO=supercontig / SO=protein_coding / is_pseudo=false
MEGDGGDSLKYPLLENGGEGGGAQGSEAPSSSPAPAAEPSEVPVKTGTRVSIAAPRSSMRTSISSIGSNRLELTAAQKKIRRSMLGVNTFGDAQVGSQLAMMKPRDQIEYVQAVEPARFERALSEVTHDQKAQAARQNTQKPLEELAAELDTSLESGISSAAAESKLQSLGYNELEKAKGKSFNRILLEQINALNMLVVAAAVIAMLQGNIPGFGDEPDYGSGVLLLFIVSICIIVGAYMEWKCNAIMADVSNLSAPTCKVMRDGQEMEIEARCLVPGDIVLLSTGDAIPADLVGLIATKLNAEEVGLTPVQKTMNKIGGLITILCIVLVTGIFLVSFFNRVNDPADPCRKDDTTCFLTKSIMRSIFNAVGAIPETLQPAVMFTLVVGCSQMAQHKAATTKLAAIDTLGSCTVICSDKTGTLTEGKMTAIRFGGVARVPGGTTALTFWPQKGFNPVGGIFNEDELDDSKKTAIQSMADNGENVFSPILTDLGDQKKASTDPRACLIQSTLMALYLNCYGTTLERDDNGYWVINGRSVGNMSEAALVVAARKAQITGTEPFSKYTRVIEAEIPFSSARKLAATVHRLPEDGMFEGIQAPKGCAYVAVVKGAPDKLLPYVTRNLEWDNGKLKVSKDAMTEEEVAGVEAINASMSGDALRVLLASVNFINEREMQTMRSTKSLDEKVDIALGAKNSGSDPPALLGLFGLMDPPRSSVKHAIRLCRQAGVRVVMITGDQTSTACAIARELGILRYSEDPAKRASICAALQDESGVDKTEREVDELTKRVNVWSRARPTDKVLIVESLQRQGHVPAMTGDGVNDAGALKTADIGVAMGITGTDVTKAAADIVLLDDNFATIVAAVEEGRRIFNNIQKLVLYLMCVNLFEVIVIMIAMICGLAVPLEEAQLFYANVVSHDFYPWCMVTEPAEPTNMQQPPRDRKKPLIGKFQWIYIFGLSFITYSACMLASQLIGSRTFTGTIYRDKMTGTEDIDVWMEDDHANYVCFKAGREDESGKFFEDRSPLFCEVFVRSVFWSTTPTTSTNAQKGWHFIVYPVNKTIPVHIPLLSSPLLPFPLPFSEGVVEFTDESSATMARAKFNGHELDRRKLKLKLSNREPPLDLIDYMTGDWGNYFEKESGPWIYLDQDFNSDSWSYPLLQKCGQSSEENNHLCWTACGKPGQETKACFEDKEYMKELQLTIQEAQLDPSLKDKTKFAEDIFKEMVAKKMAIPAGEPGSLAPAGLWKMTSAEKSAEEDDDDEGGHDADQPVLFSQWTAAAYGARKMRSMVLLTMVTMEIFLLFGISKYKYSWDAVMENRLFPMAWVPMVGLLLIFVYLPPTAKILGAPNPLGFAPLDLWNFFIAVGLAIVFAASLEFFKGLFRKEHERAMDDKVVLARLAARGEVAPFCRTTDIGNMAEARDRLDDLDAQDEAEAIRAAK